VTALLCAFRDRFKRANPIRACSPIAATATPVPSAAEQHQNYDDNQDQLDRHGNLRSGIHASELCSEALVMDFVDYINVR